jgi:TolA-binding protein
MKTYSIPALVLLILLPLARPAAAQNKEHMQMEAELRMLQEKNELLSLAFQQAMDAIKALNGRFDTVLDTMRKEFADEQLATKNMATEVSTITERMRDNDSRLRTLGDEITAMQATLTSLAATIAQNASTSAAPLDPNAPPVATAPAPIVTPGQTSIVGLSPTRMLQQAKGDYTAGQYTLAITDFEQLTKTPAFADTQAAAEAQFWIGESYYQLKKMPEAIAAYSLFLDKSPRAPYAADAAYKRGEAQRALGDLDAARASYQLAITQYPNESAAGLAQQRLDGLAATPAQNAPAGR